MIQVPGTIYYVGAVCSSHVLLPFKTWHQQASSAGQLALHKHLLATLFHRSSFFLLSSTLQWFFHFVYHCIFRVFSVFSSFIFDYLLQIWFVRTRFSCSEHFFTLFIYLLFFSKFWFWGLNLQLWFFGSWTCMLMDVHARELNLHLNRRPCELFCTDAPKGTQHKATGASWSCGPITMTNTPYYCIFSFFSFFVHFLLFPLYLIRSNSFFIFFWT